MGVSQDYRFKVKFSPNTIFKKFKNNNNLFTKDGVHIPRGGR